MSEKQEFRLCVPAELARRFKGLCIDAGKLCTCVNYLSGSARVLECEKGVLPVSCDPFLGATRSVEPISYGNVAGWLGGWLFVTAGIVSKRLNLS